MQWREGASQSRWLFGALAVGGCGCGSVSLVSPESLVSCDVRGTRWEEGVHAQCHMCHIESSLLVDLAFLTIPTEISLKLQGSSWCQVQLNSIL